MDSYRSTENGDNILPEYMILQLKRFCTPVLIYTSQNLFALVCVSNRVNTRECCNLCFLRGLINQTIILQFSVLQLHSYQNPAFFFYSFVFFISSIQRGQNMGNVGLESGCIITHDGVREHSPLVGPSLGIGQTLLCFT